MGLSSFRRRSSNSSPTVMAQGDVLIPGSSGGAFTVAMQVFENKDDQIVVSNKGLASMGYGLSGRSEHLLANPSRRVVLTEGDGGFAQNLQELGTVAINELNLKIFVMCQPRIRLDPDDPAQLLRRRLRRVRS